MLSEYDKLKRRLDESCRKEELQQKAIRTKRAEKRQIRKKGGSKIAQQLYGPKCEEYGPNEETDFNYGHNEHSNIPEQSNDSSNYECMEPIKCPRCRKFHGYCREVGEKMLPSGNESPRSNNRKSGMDWLKTEELSKTPKEAKILMVRYNKEGRFGARVEMKLAIEGQIKFLGIPPKMDDRNPNYKNLVTAFGHDENDWLEKVIHLSLEQDEFSNQYFLRIDVPKDSKSRSGNTSSRGGGR